LTVQLEFIFAQKLFITPRTKHIFSGSITYPLHQVLLKAYPKATYLVATASSPEGPFKVVTQSVNTSQTGGGDFTVFVDNANPSRPAYLAYDAWGNNHKVSIERLTDDYLDSLGSQSTTGPISPSGNEAPIMFGPRKGFYYLLFGKTCCFCSTGAGSEVWTSKTPMGPWTSSKIDINPKKSFFGKHVIPAQENYVITVPGSDDNTTTYIYTGDLWTSAHDHLKSHDLQYWQPLVFDDSISPPMPKELTWHDWITVDV